MCGIVGIVHLDRERPVDADRLVRMRDQLIHRGPDDAGVHVDGHVGLGHRRLSIIDLASGHQPMTNEDATLWIVFNGEIYNFRMLRERLVARGHRFTTSSDTEVILHLYEEEGTACVRSLNGIFAFAIWDMRRQALFLARDHMGVKPLYYAMTDDAFVFASEPKALVASGYVEPRCRERGIFEYFVFRHVSGASTLLEQVHCLLPAHTLDLTERNVRVDRFWSPIPSGAQWHGSVGSATEELTALIDDAVALQMVSDVPLGTLCSGGVDSSLVTALAARHSPQPINTFSVGFHEQNFDETAYARLVSAQYATRHHEVRLGSREFAELLPRMIWHHDGPLNFANSLQIYAISQLAKQHVTVVLTGEGADELFLGYPRYLLPSLAGAYRRLPGLLRSMAGRYARGAGNHRIEKVDRWSRHSARDALLYNSSSLDPELVRRVLDIGEGDGLEFRLACLDEAARAHDDPRMQLSLLDQGNYLVSILERQDKMSMAASIESRVPFLDYRVVEFANRLPVRYKLSGLRTKAILKRVASQFLPDRVVHRRKSGFGVPLKDWLVDAEGLGRYVDELPGSEDLAGVLKRERVAEFVAEHRAGTADHSEFLWTAINFMLWRRGLRG